MAARGRLFQADLGETGRAAFPFFGRSGLAGRVSWGAGVVNNSAELQPAHSIFHRVLVSRVEAGGGDCVPRLVLPQARLTKSLSG
jgi:hypothetical protein